MKDTIKEKLKSYVDNKIELSSLKEDFNNWKQEKNNDMEWNWEDLQEQIRSDETINNTSTIDREIDCILDIIQELEGQQNE